MSLLVLSAADKHLLLGIILQVFSLQQLLQRPRDVKTSPLEMQTREYDNIGRDFPFTRDPDRRSSSDGKNNHLTGEPGSTLYVGKETPGKNYEAPGTVTLGVTLMMGLCRRLSRMIQLILRSQRSTMME